MATVTLTLHLDPARVIDRMVDAGVGAWPEDRNQAFAQEWKALEAAGAELVEMVDQGTRVYACISEDFRRLLAKHGLVL